MRTPKLCGTQLQPEMVSKIWVVATTLRPAMNAPPGRRMPNVTAAASQVAPISAGAVVLVNEL